MDTTTFYSIIGIAFGAFAVPAGVVRLGLLLGKRDRPASVRWTDFAHPIITLSITAIWVIWAHHSGTFAIVVFAAINTLLAALTLALFVRIKTTTPPPPSEVPTVVASSIS